MCVSSDHFFLAVYICTKFSNPLSICELSNMLLPNFFSVTCNKELWLINLDVRKLFNNFEMLNIIYYLLSWTCSSTRQQHSSLGPFIKISAKHHLARESLSDQLIYKAPPYQFYHFKPCWIFLDIIYLWPHMILFIIIFIHWYIRSKGAWIWYEMQLFFP